MRPEVKEAAQKKYRELQDDREFVAYLENQERASLKAFGKPLDTETRLALAYVWKGTS